MFGRTCMPPYIFGRKCTPRYMFGRTCIGTYMFGRKSPFATLFALVSPPMTYPAVRLTCRLHRSLTGTLFAVSSLPNNPNRDCEYTRPLLRFKHFWGVTYVLMLNHIKSNCLIKSHAYDLNYVCSLT